MELNKIGLEYAADMDNVLQMIYEKATESKGNIENFPVDRHAIYLKWLPAKGLTYTHDLCDDLLRFEPRILRANNDSDGALENVSPTLYIPVFLKKGGFTAIAQKNISRQLYEEEKEKISFEKMHIDLKNSKRIFKTYWYTFAIAILGFSISLILLLLKLFKN